MVLKDMDKLKQEAQRPYRSPEYHATKNALIYAVGNFYAKQLTTKQNHHNVAI
jgi:hypothetical protein